MSNATQFKFEVSISKEVVDNALYSACCRYWASDFSWDGTSGFVEEREGDSEHDHGTRHVINAETIKHGLSELTRVSPYIFGKLLADDLDGPMSDVVLQLCAGVVRTDKGHEGEVKYG